MGGTHSDIRVLVVDDHPLIREVMRAVFSDEPGFILLGIGADAREAIDLAARYRPDVIVLDYHLPNADARETIHRLREMSAESKILVLTASTEDQDARTAVVAGVHGFLTKHADSSQILQAVRTVADGEIWLDNTAQRALGMAAFPDPKIP